MYVSSYFCPTRYLIVKDLGHYCEPSTLLKRAARVNLASVFFQRTYARLSVEARVSFYRNQ